MTSTPAPASPSRHAWLSEFEGLCTDRYLVGIGLDALLDYLDFRAPYGQGEPNYPESVETVLVYEPVFDAACQRYASAVQLATILDNDRTDIRVIDETGWDGPTMALGTETAFTLTSKPEGTTLSCESAEPTNPGGFYDDIVQLAGDAEPGVVSVPPIWTVTGTAGRIVSDEFAAMIHWVMEQSRNHRDLRKEVTDYYAPILAGAVTEEQFIHIKRFAEAVGIGSQRTIHRRKKDLENGGIVSTKRVRVNWGRPRQQLFLEEDWQDYSAFSELLVGAEERI